MEIWLQNYWHELAGTIFALIYLFLSIRENIWLWPIGFLTSFFYLIVFYKSQLYADMSLQFYYLIISVYGWFHWLGKRKVDIKPETRIQTKSLNRAQWLNTGAAFVILQMFIYAALLYLPGWLDIPPSDLPIGDSFTTAASIVATWMLARKILENWLIWIVVNSVSMGMYIYKELHITVFLFAVYTVMAVIGYYKWKQNMPKHQL